MFSELTTSSAPTRSIVGKIVVFILVPFWNDKTRSLPERVLLLGLYTSHVPGKIITRHRPSRRDQAATLTISLISNKIRDQHQVLTHAAASKLRTASRAV